MSGLLLLVALMVSGGAAEPVKGGTRVIARRALRDTTPRPLIVTVTDADRGWRLAGARVFVGNDTSPAVTDSGGRARYGRLVTEKAVVRVSLTGYLGDTVWSRRDGDTLRAAFELYSTLPRQITGRASDGVSQAPLRNAAVVVTSTDIVAATDSMGRYSIGNLPPGEVTVSFSLAGFHETWRLTRVAGGDSVSLDVPLYNQKLHGRLSGRVTDAVSGEPLPGAYVMLVGTEMGANADANGVYLVTNVPPGDAAIEAGYLGYKTERVMVRVLPDEQVRLDFKLKQTSGLELIPTDIIDR